MASTSSSTTNKPLLPRSISSDVANAPIAGANTKKLGDITVVVVAASSSGPQHFTDVGILRKMMARRIGPMLMIAVAAIIIILSFAAADVPSAANIIAVGGEDDGGGPLHHHHGNPLYRRHYPAEQLAAANIESSSSLSSNTNNPAKALSPSAFPPPFLIYVTDDNGIHNSNNNISLSVAEQLEQYERHLDAELLSMQQHLLFTMEFGLDTRNGTDRTLTIMYFTPLMLIGTLGWLIDGGGMR